ncbi:sensor histidine kinase [Sedimentitalea nanhaiensis]|uniref:histidine kinase n=1 Tax=Sedimentitalea nanhaiensis TaxID=999627 RepID=A0A1I6YXJ2_9RHOB|nr:HAMP domain-containing sensor histidine kinase [Sedimentitalea nanhaiensis]SFT55147.1 Signal transduction histidine kinase [Sedimentitalea nanhaiensis]
MSTRLSSLLRSMPLKLALGLVILFSMVSLISLAASYVVTQRSLEQGIRDNLTQDIAGFRAAPNAGAVAALVEAVARETDPERMVLSYLAPNRRQYGNAAIARDDEGYHIVSLSQDSPDLKGQYLALTTSLYGGQLTVARSRAEIDALRRVFVNILGLSLVPTILIALSGGLYLARRSARHVARIGQTLDRLTRGDLRARVGPVPEWSDDLAEIGAKIDQMAHAQEGSVEAIRQVSSDIAHDLKTPIQRVAVHLEDLSQRTGLDDPSRDLVDLAKQELDGVVSVFGSLLQIAQIESGTPGSRFQPVDLGELVATCVELYEPAAAETGHALTARIAPDVPRVAGDRNLLLQLMANLVENAMRHTPDGTAIAFSLTAREGKAVLSVADRGPGIPADETENVLQRLYRLDRSRMTPGSGLGLSLVSVVARLHGADLVLQDNHPGLRVSLTFGALAGRHGTADAG